MSATVVDNSDGHLSPFQQRMLVERRDLSDKVYKLSVFIGTNPAYSTLDPAEQERLKNQLRAMKMYLDILSDRIAVFDNSYVR